MLKKPISAIANRYMRFNIQQVNVYACTYMDYMCSIQSIPKLRFCNLGCLLLLNQHHQHGSRRPRMFRPYSMNTLVAGHRGGPTVVINHCALVDCFQLISSRLSHSQLDARSAAWLSLWIAIFLSLPLVIPPANFVCGSVYCFHVVRPSDRTNDRPCVRNVLFP